MSRKTPLRRNGDGEQTRRLAVGYPSWLKLEGFFDMSANTRRWYRSERGEWHVIICGIDRKGKRCRLICLTSRALAIVQRRCLMHPKGPIFGTSVANRGEPKRLTIASVNDPGARLRW
jgi:hypothetical protein